MDRKIVIAGALILVIGLIFIAQRSDPPSENSFTPATAHFIKVVREKVIREIGQPIEGFEPFMFLEVYPGLLAEDFIGVEAQLGIYELGADGELLYVESEPQLHSAARAITDYGMGTILENIARRLELPLTTIPEVDSIIDKLEDSSLCSYGEFGTSYVRRNRAECVQVEVYCVEGTEAFTNVCGCGCRIAQ